MTNSSRARSRRIQQGAWLASFAAASLALPALALAAAESTSEKIGPWEIETTFKGDKFDRCSVHRKLDDDIVASFVRTGDDLALELESPNWKLDRGKTYPVKMNVGPLSFDTEVAAEPNSVSMGVKDKKFEAGLRNASALNIVAAGATIKVPLDKSSDAFERLEQCVEKNDKAVATNPFVEGKPSQQSKTTSETTPAKRVSRSTLRRKDGNWRRSRALGFVLQGRR